MNEERQQSHRVAFLGTHNWRGEAGPLPQSLDRRAGMLERVQALRGGWGTNVQWGAREQESVLVAALPAEWLAAARCVRQPPPSDRAP